MYVTLFLKLDLRTINQTLHHVITDGVKKEGNNYGFKENKHKIWMGDGEAFFKQQTNE